MKNLLTITVVWLGAASFCFAQVDVVKTPNRGIQPQAIMDAKGTLHLLYFQGKARPKEPDQMAAPIWYDNLMLIVSDGQGVAAVIFKKEWNEQAKGSTNCGVHYQFRYVGRKAKKEVRGDGFVREKHRFKPTKDPKVFDIVDNEDRLFIEAGPLRMAWSYYAEGRGWIYYVPEKMSVQIGNAKAFSDVDLKRFGKR